MNRVDRLMAFVTVLQSKKFVTGEHLAQKFNISVRTVYRDIKALIEMNIPVGFENNRGYFIMQGYFLPPVAFTTDEANALALMESIAEQFTDESVKQHYETALRKIKAVLKGSQKDKVEHLSGSIKTLKHQFVVTEFKYLSAIQNAIAGKSLLHIQYQNTKDEKSRRDIEPIGLIFYAMNWHVIAWDWKSHEYRDFRASRILSLSDTHTPFRRSNHPGINEYMRINKLS